MPTIPVYDAPQVQQSGLPVEQANPNVSGLGDGLSQGYSALGNAGDAIVKDIGDAREKADAAAAAAAEANFTATINTALHDPKAGVLNKEGMAAVQASTDTYAQLQKQQQAISQTLQNERQRKLFDVRSRGILEQAHVTVENHVGQQIRVAQRASVDGLKATSLDAVAANYADPAARARFMAQPEGPIRALSLSKEDSDAQLADWRSKVHATVLNQYMAAQDAKGAQQYFAQVKDELGARAPQFEHQITELNTAVQSDHEALAITQQALEPGYPWLDMSRAFATVEAMPAGPLKDATQKRVEHLVELNQKMKQDAGREKLGELLQIGSPYDPRVAPIKAWMMDPKNGAGDLYERWERDLRANARADRYDAIEARREQKERDRDAIADFRARPVGDQSRLDISREYLGQGVSPWAQSQMRAYQQKAKEDVQKGNEVKGEEFNRMVDAEAARASITAKPVLNQLKAYMTNWRDTHREEHNGKEPSIEETRKALGEALRTGDAGHFWSPSRYRFQLQPGDTFNVAPPENQKSPLNRAPAASPQAPAAPAQRIRAYRYTNDRKRRKPVFADGSLGDWENVNGQ